MLFSYVGYHLDGTRIRARKEADSEDEIRTLLYEEQIEVESVSRVWWHVPLGGSRKVKDKDILVFTRLLGALLRGHMNTAQSLDVLYRQTQNPTFKRILTDISIQVRSGTRLSLALQKHPKTFGTVFTNVVAAGEKSGSLAAMLGRLGHALHRTQQIKSKIKIAVMYPAILAATVVIVGALLLYFIIPEFAAIFQKGGYELPAATLFLIGLSEMVRSAGPMLLVGLVALIVGIPYALQQPSIRLRADTLLLKAPILGELVVTGAMANYCRIMAMTLSSGMVTVEALRMAVETVANLRIQNALRDALVDLQTGSRLAPALERTGLVPPLVVAVTNVGERSGELSEQMENAAELFEEEVIHEVEKTLKLLEPALIILVFISVAALLIGVYTPLFKAISMASE